MNYFSSIIFMLFTALLALGASVLIMNIRPKLKYVFAMYIFATALTLLFRIYASLPAGQVTAKGLWFWYSASSFINSFLPFLTIHFVLVMSGRGKKYNNLFLFPALFLSLLLGVISLQKGTLVSGFRLEEFGYAQVRSGGAFWIVLYSAYSSIAYLAAIFLCFDWYRNAKSELEERQSQFMLAGNTLIFICAFTIYGYLGGNRYKYSHLMGSILQTLILAVYSYAIFRYRLLEDSRIIAARNIIKNMSEVFILADNKDDSIIEVNEAAVKLLGLPEKTLLRKKAKDILFIEKDPPPVLTASSAADVNKAGQYEGYLRTGRGERIPVEFNVSAVNVEKIGFSGSVIVANDVSEMLGFIERQKQKNKEMNITYTELKKKRDFMKRFQNITGKRSEHKQKLLEELKGLKTNIALSGSRDA